MRYVKKIIPVDAVQWTGPEIKHPAIKQVPTDCWSMYAGQYYVSTIENDKLFLKPNCWIVGPGVGGEYWPVDDLIFRQSYAEYEEPKFSVEGPKPKSESNGQS